MPGFVRESVALIERYQEGLHPTSRRDRLAAERARRANPSQRQWQPLLLGDLRYRSVGLLKSSIPRVSRVESVGLSLAAAREESAASAAADALRIEAEVAATRAAIEAANDRPAAAGRSFSERLREARGRRAWLPGERVAPAGGREPAEPPSSDRARLDRLNALLRERAIEESSLAAPTGSRASWARGELLGRARRHRAMLVHLQRTRRDAVGDAGEAPSGFGDVFVRPLEERASEALWGTLEALPIRVIEREGRTADSDATDASASEGCAICCDNWSDGDRLRRLPCLHEFHQQCIDPWLLRESSHGRCPVCRSSVVKGIKRGSSRRMGGAQAERQGCSA